MRLNKRLKTVDHPQLELFGNGSGLIPYEEASEIVVSCFPDV